MNLKNLSDQDLLCETKLAVSEERNQTSKVLCYLREVERRRLFLEKGCASMFVFCMKELGYDEHQTQRRLAAMRLLMEIPEIGSKIASGELSLTALNKAKTTFNKMAKPPTKDEKLAILKTLESKTIRECERELIKVCPEALPKKQESQRLLTEHLAELKVVVNRKTLEKLSKLKNLLSHKSPNMTMAELIDLLAEEMLQRKDPEKRMARRLAKRQNVVEKSWRREATKNSLPESRNAAVQHAPAQVKYVIAPITQNKTQSHRMKNAPERTRHIPAETKNQVWQRDQGKCTFRDPITQEQCGSTFQIEFEHVKAFSLGGENTPANLTLHCRAHNLHQAIKTLGVQKMQEFLPRLEC